MLITTDDETYDTDTASEPLELSNTDIAISNGVYTSPSALGFTINYSETSEKDT